jgi:phosphatidylinositol dimannoside acyltransferase
VIDAPSQDALPRRWTLHGLNNGVIFRMTVRGVRILPRAASYGIGRAGTWLAWRVMSETRAAIVENLGVIVPAETTREREKRARRLLLAYARDTIDFLRALSASPAELARTFDLGTNNQAIFDAVLRDGRGGLLVTGHCGNWEIGGLLMSRVVRLPLTIVAMAEADPDVNRLRQEIRSRMGIETLEVRQSLDTALQIRRLLAANRFVAMLIDRHLGRDRVAVRFFGRETWFLQTPAVLAYMTGAPLVPCFIERVGPGRFTTLAFRPIQVDRSLPREQAVQQATQTVATAIEARVRANPEAWYQFYRYWDAQE